MMHSPQENIDKHKKAMQSLQEQHEAAVAVVAGELEQERQARSTLETQVGSSSLFDRHYLRLKPLKAH